MQLIEHAVAYATDNMLGLVIHNDAQHFSCGADLGTILGFVESGDMAGLDAFLD